MIFLRSKEKYNEIAILDSNSKKLIQLSSEETPEVNSLEISGHFAILDSHQIYLYRAEKVLFFGYDDKVFEIEDSCVARLEVGGTLNKLSLICGGNLIFSVNYHPSVIDPPIELDPTPFIELEDYDFCLFVANVVNDPSRRRRIYT